MKVSNISSFSYDNQSKKSSKNQNFGLRIIDAKFVKGKNETMEFFQNLFKYTSSIENYSQDCRQQFLEFMMAIKGFLGDKVALKGKKELFGSGMKIYYGENGKKLMTMTANTSYGVNQIANLYNAIKKNQSLTDESLEIFAEKYVFGQQAKGLNTTELFSKIYKNAPNSEKGKILTNVLALQEMCNPDKQLALVGFEMGSGRMKILLNGKQMTILNEKSSLNELVALVKKVKDKLGIVKDTEVIASEKLFRPDLRE